MTRSRKEKTRPTRPVEASLPAVTSGSQGLWVFVAILAVVTFVIFSPVREFAFVNYDDPDYVSANPIVQQGVTMAGVKWTFTTAHSFNWHPLTWISHMLDCKWFGADAGKHHLMSVFFHVINTGLLLIIFARGTGKLWPSVFIAAVFALHPLHVESAVWVCERKDVLSTFFWLLTMFFYFRYAKGGGRVLKSPAYILALVSFALGLMAKPMLVTLPCVLLLLDLWPLNRIAKLDLGHLKSLILEKLPFFALTIISCVVTFLVQRSQGAVADTTTFSPGLRVANALIAYVRYLGKTFWPTDLVVFYSYPETWSILLVIGAAVVLLALSALAIRFWKRAPYLFVGWFWFVGTLVPVIGLVQVGLQSMADRYMYVPMIGLSLAITWSAVEWFAGSSSAKRGAIAVIGIVALVACTVLTRDQIQHWRDSRTLFAHALTVSPDNVMARVMMGNACNDAGDVACAVEQYSEALKRSPNFAEVHYNLGNLYVGQNQLSKAIEHYEKTLSIRPDFLDGRANYAVALGMARQYDEAIAQYETVLKERPDDPLLLRNVSVDLMAMGKLPEAETKISRAIEISPGEPMLYMISGDIFVKQGRRADAATRYSTALQLDPNLADARRKLAAVASN